MQIDGLQASSALRIFRYSNIDHFRQALSAVEADITPLNATDFAPMQALVRLPDCEVLLMRSFPRVIDATMSEGKTMILFPMEDVSSSTVNGTDVTFPALALVSGRTGYKVVEREARLTAAIQFSTPMHHRGWPASDNSFTSFRISHAMLWRLQRLMRHMFAFASMEALQWDTHGLGVSIQTTLLALLDEAMHSAVATGFELTASYRKQFRIAGQIDDMLAANPAAPIYSEALARQIGVSVRTLHNATVRMRGVSLHQYLRLRRLWLVRQRLASGDPALHVKTCAMSYGFWHLGEFSSAYTTLFGELPSHTLARARS